MSSQLLCPKNGTLTQNCRRAQGQRVTILELLSHKDIEEAGMIEWDGKIRNSPLYRLADTPLIESLHELAAVTAKPPEDSDD